MKPLQLSQGCWKQEWHSCSLEDRLPPARPAGLGSPGEQTRSRGPRRMRPPPSWDTVTKLNRLWSSLTTTQITPVNHALSRRGDELLPQGRRHLGSFFLPRLWLIKSPKEGWSPYGLAATSLGPALPSPTVILRDPGTHEAERQLQTCRNDKLASVAQSCPILYDPVDCSPPGSSVHGTLQARILEWAAIAFSRGSFQPRDGTCSFLHLLHWQMDSFPTAQPGIPRLGRLNLDSSLVQTEPVW